MKILALYSIKGGVGKTTTAVNLAHLAAAEGLRTLVWDLDPQGAASFFFRVKPKVKGGSHALLKRRRAMEESIKGTDFERLDLLPADFSYRHLDLELGNLKRSQRRFRGLLKPLGQDYDWVFLDCAPSISRVSESVFHASDGLLVPLVPATLSVRTLEQLSEFLSTHMKRHAPRLLPFFSMTDDASALHRDTMQRLQRRYRGVLITPIPHTVEIERMGSHRMPVTAYAADAPGVAAYRALWAEVKAALESTA